MKCYRAELRKVKEVEYYIIGVELGDVKWVE